MDDLGHGIPNELLLRTLSVTRQLFDLDTKIKNQYAARLFVDSKDVNLQSGGFGRGYQSVGENVTNTKRDRHEGFDLYRELESNHPLRLQFNEKHLTNQKLPDYREMAIGWNPWPKEFPLFKETINEYTSAMLQVGERVMRAIALSLNLPLNYFESTFNDSFWVKEYFLSFHISFFFIIRLFDVFVILLSLQVKVNHLNMVMVVVNILIMVG